MPSQVEIAESAIYQTVGNEVVVLNLGTERYYGLNDTAAAMWHLLLEHGGLSVVAAVLAAEYAAEEVVIRADLNRLVTQLMGVGLVKAA
jgi:hypothetical protein